MAKLFRIIAIYVTLAHIISLNVFTPKNALHSESYCNPLGVVAKLNGGHIFTFLRLGSCMNEGECSVIFEADDIIDGMCATLYGFLVQMEKRGMMGKFLDGTLGIVCNGLERLDESLIDIEELECFGIQEWSNQRLMYAGFLSREIYDFFVTSLLSVLFAQYLCKITTINLHL